MRHLNDGYASVDKSLNSVQYSTVQYSTVQYSTVQYSTVQDSTVQYRTVQYMSAQMDLDANSSSDAQSKTHFLLKTNPENAGGRNSSEMS